ncbi:gliding motility lipoprotein GldH [Pedobacter metabolipauper]|uniref:Gliding motility-associated lipoprotein GldH n=1 Tax=Pedobacter metabolipauper TaxID=425513 RepID=A0A4R6SYD0_9SPHI|nr:gliding motility lipoprotein GldH [Pedobacter metabolipauper]TDQ09505.1 gliding motility-associated lipoprotein GldH [Pedobacter metabolipauper]
MNNCKVFLVFFAFFIALLSGCDTNAIVDNNISMPARNWSYANRVKAVVDIKDPNQITGLYFKLRHTADYRYSNVFVLLHISGAGQKKITKRYEYKLALSDGQWLGSGSGNLYTYVLPLLTNYKFPAAGKYQIEIEQNMRDNPLSEISDAGIKILNQR